MFRNLIIASVMLAATLAIPASSADICFDIWAVGVRANDPCDGELPGVPSIPDPPDPFGSPDSPAASLFTQGCDPTLQGACILVSCHIGLGVPACTYEITPPQVNPPPVPEAPTCTIDHVDAGLPTMIYYPDSGMIEMQGNFVELRGNCGKYVDFQF